MNDTVKRAYELNKEEADFEMGYIPDVEVGDTV